MKRINLNPITGFQAKLYHILGFFFANDKAVYGLFFLQLFSVVSNRLCVCTCIPRFTSKGKVVPSAAV